MTRTALYARVSTSDQTVEPQLHALRAYAEARRFEVVDEFVDVVSGARESRPALDRLMSGAHRQRFDVVACQLCTASRRGSAALRGRRPQAPGRT